MSQRTYITVSDYRVSNDRIYEWAEPRTEYTCDTCSREILFEEPQIHLNIQGMLFQSGKSIENVLPFKGDFHFTPDCIRGSGPHLLRELP